MSKNVEELIPIIEGVLFAATEPLSAEAIGKLFIDETKPKTQDIKKALSELKKHYQDRGIELVEVATGFRFQVAQIALPYIVKSTEEKPARYSRALLETLALIAYRQPITRGEIEDIRGVVVSTNIIKTLDEQGWIRVVGYKEVPGKPGLYATTKAFLDHFGLKSLEDLPPLAELKNFEDLPAELEGQLELDIEEKEEEIEQSIETDISVQPKINASVDEQTIDEEIEAEIEPEINEEIDEEIVEILSDDTTA